MVPCRTHPEVPSVVVCEVCVTPLCDACIRYDGGRKICSNCLENSKKEGQQLRVRRALSRMAVVLAIGGGAWAFSKYEVDYDYGKRSNEVEKQTAALAQDPCDAAAMEQLAKTMVAAGNEDVALEKSLAFLEKCPDAPKLRYLVYDLYQQQGQTEKAIEQTTKLIDSNPYDPDYWTWRGLRRLDSHAWELAAADLRQAMMLRPNGPGVPMQLAEAWREAGQPCEGIGPLLWLQRYHPELPEAPDVAKRLGNLGALPECAAWKATGSDEFHFVPGEAGVLAKVTLDGKHSGSFLIDTDVNYVALNPSFASAAGLSGVSGTTWIVETIAGQKKLPVLRIKTLQAGALGTGEVPAVILPEDIRGADGILGQEFLQRFVVDGKYADLKISAK